MKKLICLLCLLCLSLPSSAQTQAEVEEALRKLYMATVMTSARYVDTVNVNELTEAAIRGMLDKLDPHSTYTNAKETKQFNESMQGSFEGIGVQFNILDDTLMVIQTVAKGPSEKAGIMAGDRIISVNDTAIAGVKMKQEEIMSRLRGPKGSIARLGIKRQGVKETVYFNVKRDKIPVHTLDAAYMVTPTIGLIRFSQFGQTTYDEVTEAIRKLKAEGMESLILDLQQNGGGLLNIAADLASEFLPKGDTIVYTRGRAVPQQMFRSKGGTLFQTGKLVVLVDEYSASASEILAGAIQDNDRGWVVGRRSFGKGLVQVPIELPDHSMIKLTVSRYYTPSGRSIQKPYTKGDRKSYNMDAITRYNNGELTNADSIHFPDSLRYYTRKQHRVVYGGGGIMPDQFVPLDTTRFTPLYRQISARGMIVQANLRFLDKNRKRLSKKWKQFADFKEQFEMPEETLDAILTEAEEKNFKPKDEEEKQQTRRQLALTLKALVARDLWDMSEYFSVIYQDDPVVLKAVEMIEGR